MGIDRQPRILCYDIETAPIIGTIWTKWEANMIWSVQDWYMLCFAYKWADEKKTHVVAQDDFKGYKPGSPDDSKVVQKLHELFNEADVVVAHNGDSFDQKKSQARFILNDLEPPTPYQQIDTKKVAKRYFNFTSNKLDDLGEYFKVGKKLPTSADLWRGCMAGDKKSWAKMKSYNKQDVILLEQVYLKMRPWMTNHPNMANIAGRPESCSICLAEEGFLAQGWRTTKTAKYRRWQCKACGSYISDRAAMKGERVKYA